MEDKQIADYFVVAGFTDKSMPLEDFSFDGNQLKSTYDQAPITDITVIIPSLGEGIPPGFTCIEYTPTGLTADLNYGSIRSPEVFLCYRRGRERPPLFDIGVLYQGKEQLMSDAEVVLSTPYGRAANVNNSANQHTYVTYRRAPDTAPCNDLVVSDICVVITSKGETPPHAYCMIKKNLNKGMLGADVYLCYKKSMNKPRHIAYRPGIQARFPEEDIPHNPMPDSVPLFCLPMGATLEWWPINAATPKPVFSTFVLTVSDAAEKIYGSAVTFYERYPEEKMTKEQKAWLDMDDVDDGSTEKDYTVNTIKSICILSHYPFFDTFEKFLRYLHKVAHSGPYPVPLERYITHFMYDVPFPSPQRPRILIQLSATDRIALAQLEDLPLPRRGASFKSMLLNLGPDGCLQLLLLALTEQKILIHSLRPDVLTATAEALATSIFPFKWQCPYIPLCPLGLSDVLSAPLPYLIGVDSRFFDMYDPPAEVSCVDLDTNTISISEEKKTLLTVKLLPKKAARTLRATLQYLYEKIYSTFWSERGKRGDDVDSSLDRDFKIKKKELLLELEIQEAFLKFMASILRGYRSYLLPITKAPTVGATDPNSLFDLQGFLRSRDKAYVKFYALMMKTQMFIRFIEERSFVSDMDSSLAFFDECSDKTDLDDGDIKLLELDDSHHSERTVFVTPPEPVGLPSNVTYTYQQFGTLNAALMQRPLDESLFDPSAVGSSTKPRSSSGNMCGSSLPPPSSPLARRTKHEIKNSQKFAKKYAETPMLWAKCLLNTCFSIWFIHLPSHILTSNSKVTTLRSAYAILVAMQKLRVLPADEVCYRVMMQLCGVLGQPVLAVKVLFEMKRHGVQPNAITYGFYNKAVLEAHWSSDMANHSRLLWNKLRNVVTAAGLFRQAGRKAAQSRISQYSSTDEGDLASNSDGDGLSRTSVDSAQEGHHSAGVGGAPIVYRNSTVTSSQSDVGYSSMKEDGQANQNQKPKCSSQKDLPTAVKAEESVDICGSRATNNKTAKTVTAVIPVTVRLDFSQSNEFRTRVGSIVRKSANAVPHKSVDSAAGVLMSSLGSGGGALSPIEATELKAALDDAGHNISHPSPPQPKGATLPREKSAGTPMASGNSTPDASSQTKSSSQSASTASLFSPQNLNARKAEFLVGLNNLKSAASSVAKKIDEIKGAIGAGVTVTPSKLSGSGLLTESMDARGGSASGSGALLTVDGPADGSLETWSSWTAQWLRRASSADLVSQQYPATGSATPSEWSTTDGQASSNIKGLPSWTETSAQLDRLCASMRFPNGGRRQRLGEELPIAIEVIMTSCSKCHNCSSILYDEEIMAGWTPEDSNLNSRCQHCKKLLVPFLTTHLHDYRSHPPLVVQQMISNLTPGVSQESVISSSHSRNGSDGGEKPAKEDEAVSKQAKAEKNPPTPLVAPAMFGPISVPYLSPLVLRRELEGILEQEGDVCLTQASFVDQHSIIYWNMLWYFERVGLMSHMAALILRANLGLNETNNNNDSEAANVTCRINPSWSSADEKNISVKTKWDNTKLHDELGPPCYALWQQTYEQHSPLVSALVTDNQSFPRSFLDELLRGIQYNDMLRPLKQLSSELIKRKTVTGIARHHGIYRELLFLSFVAIGRENIDQIAFDREYRLAYDRLDAQSMATLGKVDSPPSIASVFCRHFFRQLEL
ncbi:DENN domain-containing protein Crag-like isoform X4 [Daphnia pulicaria]|uniref:DENN domain-containing protein Crag-like isoform X4 n=1 Tax=Daphnia pulicaria TaxID=35523 RepID=UPI001EE9BEC8|nr:DENN domain-containing protein Crag-like isoform X4 [Daphnia pulicaria]